MNPVKFRNNRAWILQSVHFYQESNKNEQQAAVKGCEITGGLLITVFSSKISVTFNNLSTIRQIDLFCSCSLSKWPLSYF